MTHAYHFNDNLRPNLYRENWYSSSYSPRWVKVPPPALTQRNIRASELRQVYRNPENTDGRYFRPETLVKISETLGALNTVGRYLVNMTRGAERSPSIPEDIPDAIYTLSEQVLGRNVTDTIAPLVREALPVHTTVTPTQSPHQFKPTTESSNSRDCTTPDGLPGWVTLFKAIVHFFIHVYL